MQLQIKRKEESIPWRVMGKMSRICRSDRGATKSVLRSLNLLIGEGVSIFSGLQINLYI